MDSEITMTTSHVHGWYPVAVRDTDTGYSELHKISLTSQYHCAVRRNDNQLHKICSMDNATPWMDVDYPETSTPGVPHAGSFTVPTTTDNAFVPRNHLGSPNPFPFLMDVDTSDRRPEASVAQQPKRGHPKKITVKLSASDVQNHHRLGRPPGSGPKQQAKAELLASG
ncbi:uncharacterized protein LACBIDRAFT_329229 [Laccaria bicolor S238N-H82]|uniref:Predicted protein n=1 Tax=Laccaria bicolor (strain S238N-H82 / ATCC MYA-4686) TaxID=486041 RepID=B0DHF8_LACBS|nr:uncharacterized protein LACBIDRAFT_329229 [Laccaria bicolor S238N-H82]EDR06011.1 predicted protein [Laccaria bicolor S238N-H82]|eukprot:XP_001883299.1 predicted protein [Laccaria bicolor S238N-H82]